LQPGVNQVSVRVVAELLRLPTINGSVVRPTGGSMRVKIAEEGRGLYLGAESAAVPGGNPLKVVSLRGSSETDFTFPIELGRVYTIAFEIGLLNPNPFPVIFSPTVDSHMEIDILSLGLENPVGSASDTANVSIDIRGAGGEMLQFTFENPTGESVGWQFDSQHGPIFRGLGHYWKGELAPAN